MPSLKAVCFDVGGGGLGNPQAVQGLHKDEACSMARPNPTVTGRTPIWLQSKAIASDSSSSRGGAAERPGIPAAPLPFRVAVEPFDGAQPAGDRSSGSAPFF
jgi:hypothetical protein